MAKKSCDKSKYLRKSFIFLVSVIFIFFIVINLVPIVKKSMNANNVRFIGSNDTISIGNVLPLTDASGKNLSTVNVDKRVLNEVNFSVKGVGYKDVSVDYEIYLINNSSSDTINQNYIKVYLTDGNKNPFNYYASNAVPVYSSLRVSNDKPDGKIIYAGSIKGGEKQSFTLRLWLADNYIINNEDKNFEGMIAVRKVS